MSMHFPFVEAGRVRPLCRERGSKTQWTTKVHGVTCPRCLKLLRPEADAANTGARDALVARHERIATPAPRA